MPTAQQVLDLFGVADASALGTAQGFRHDPRILLNACVMAHKAKMRRTHNNLVTAFSFNGSLEHETTDEEWQEVQRKFAGLQAFIARGEHLDPFARRGPPPAPAAAAAAATQSHNSHSRSPSPSSPSSRSSASGSSEQEQKSG